MQNGTGVIGVLLNALSAHGSINRSASPSPPDDGLFQLYQARGVIGGLPFIENQNLLVGSERLAVAVGKPDRGILLPDQVVAKQLPRAVDQSCGKWLGCKQHQGALGLHDPLVLLPQRLKGNHRVPGASRGTVRKITQHQIHRACLHPGHAHQTVPLEQADFSLKLSIHFAPFDAHGVHWSPTGGVRLRKLLWGKNLA